MIFFSLILVTSSGQSLFDEAENFGASAPRRNQPRGDRSFNGPRPPPRRVKLDPELLRQDTSSDETEAEAERSLSLFDPQSGRLPNEIGYGQFYANVGPNTTNLLGQRKDNSNTQIIINLNNNPHAYLGSGYSKHKPEKEEEEPGPPAPPAPPGAWRRP